MQKGKTMDRSSFSYTKTLYPKKFSNGTPINRRIFGLCFKNTNQKNEQKTTASKTETENNEE